MSICGMHEALVIKSQNQATFCWSVWQIRMTNLNLMQSLHGYIFHPHRKFQIAQIPIEMTFLMKFLPVKICRTKVNVTTHLAV